MAKEIEKSLLLCPAYYSLHGSLLDILQQISDFTYNLDLRIYANNIEHNIHTQIFRLPYSIRSRWEKHFLNKLNQGFIDNFKNLKPDLVFVYNSEFLTPETCTLIKKTAKLIFFLGDSPFYTFANNNLAILKYADLILSPDTFWNEQLNTIGLSRTSFFTPGINSKHYFEVEKDIKMDLENEVLYVGTSYVNSWGYKKALYMNQFTNLNLHIYGGRHWKKWFNDFPKLKDKFIECDYIPYIKLNSMMNSSKIIPVDGNPGILNGFHLRLLEALGAGALPVVEYRKDVEHELFKGCKVMVPLVRDYRKAGEIAKYYLQNENERKELARELKNHITYKYSTENNAYRILEMLSIKQ